MCICVYILSFTREDEDTCVYIMSLTREDEDTCVYILSLTREDEDEESTDSPNDADDLTHVWHINCNQQSDRHPEQRQDDPAAMLELVCHYGGPVTVA